MLYRITTARAFQGGANEELRAVEEAVVGAIGEDRLGGLWLTRPDDQAAVTVGVVNPSTRDRDLLASLELPVEILVVRANRSTADLQRAAAELGESFASAGVEAAVIFDFKGGALRIKFDPASDPAALVRMEDAWAADWIVYEGLEDLGLSAYPTPGQSGVREYHQVWGGWRGCTAGFAGVRSGGAKVQFTAAHCADSAGLAVHASTGDNTGVVDGHYGTGVLWAPTGNAPDVMLHSSPDATPHVYVNSNYKRTVVGQANPMWLETDICYRGASSTTEKCGGVSYFANFTVGGRTFDGFCLGGATPIPGDSGSGIYKKLSGDRASARGILWGYQGSNACGTSINDDSAYLGALVLT
ncbi:MAG: hypothetical protein R2754_11545 [Microthrixaceae bacterium]